MEPLCEGDHLRVFVDGAVQASITLGAVVQPSFGPNGELMHVHVLYNLQPHLNTIGYVSPTHPRFGRTTREF